MTMYSLRRADALVYGSSDVPVTLTAACLPTTQVAVSCLSVCLSVCVCVCVCVCVRGRYTSGRRACAQRTAKEGMWTSVESMSVCLSVC